MGSILTEVNKTIKWKLWYDYISKYNLQTMNYAVKTAATSFSINQGSLSDSFIAANIVTLMMPVIEHQDDAICRVWCIDTETAKQFKLISGTWTFQFDL